MIPHALEISPFRDLDRWHDLLSHRYVCESCLTRYFKKYHKCKACGSSGTIQFLTASLFEIADTDQELRTLIAHGQKILYTIEPAPASPPATDFSEGPP